MSAVGPSEKIVWKLYIAIVGVGTAMVARLVVGKAWETVTGEKPPAPTDPETPTSAAITWVLASGVGVGMAQLMARRMATKHWRERAGIAAGGDKVRIAVEAKAN